MSVMLVYLCNPRLSLWLSFKRENREKRGFIGAEGSIRRQVELGGKKTVLASADLLQRYGRRRSVQKLMATYYKFHFP